MSCSMAGTDLGHRLLFFFFFIYQSIELFSGFWVRQFLVLNLLSFSWPLVKAEKGCRVLFLWSLVGL